MPLADGANFAGFTIERLLGTGGMGEVYLVRHPRLPKREALKILPESVSADADYRRRFAREADLAAALWHPHIVAIHDRGEYDGQLWITMDYVEGTDAARLMRNRYPLGMPPDEVFEIITAIADALDYAHESLLLHRDVKPANILISTHRAGARRILLADFGIARATGDANGLTATNMAVGSVAYAAPEQLTGRPLDGRADQYALACTAFHLLSGGPPFVDSNAAVVISSHLSSPVPRLGAARPDLGGIDDVLARAMAKDPHQRFSSCREFALALTHSGAGAAAYTAPTQYGFPAYAVSSPTITHPQVPPAEEGKQITVSRRAALIAGGLIALLAVGLVSFVGARLGQSDSPTTPAAPPAQSTLIYPEPTEAPSRPPRTVTKPAEPSTVTKVAPPAPAPAPAPTPAPRPAPPPAALPGDLGLRTKMTRPACNGQGIVVLGNVTTPGQYASGIQRLLNLHPGASYLRTDQSCPSLRQASDEGNPIYAVYRPAGFGLGQLCAAVRAAGGDAYGKILDTKTDPGYIPC